MNWKQYKQAKANEQPKGYDRQATQWAFTVLRVKDEDIKLLSTLPLKDICYINFSVSEDNSNNNRYIEGFVKTVKRCRTGFLLQLFGRLDSCHFNVCTTPMSVSNVLT